MLVVQRARGKAVDHHSATPKMIRRAVAVAFIVALFLFFAVVIRRFKVGGSGGVRNPTTAIERTSQPKNGPQGSGGPLLGFWWLGFNVFGQGPFPDRPFAARCERLEAFLVIDRAQPL